MKGRARLARRILREHRQGWPWHRSRDRDYRHPVIYYHWRCPHCAQGCDKFIPFEVPRAYR